MLGTEEKTFNCNDIIKLILEEDVKENFALYQFFAVNKSCKKLIVNHSGYNSKRVRVYWYLGNVPTVITGIMRNMQIAARDYAMYRQPLQRTFKGTYGGTNAFTCVNNMRGMMYLFSVHSMNLYLNHIIPFLLEV